MSYEVILQEGATLDRTEIYTCAEVEVIHSAAEFDRESGRESSPETFEKEISRYYTKVGNDENGFQEFPLKIADMPLSICRLYEQMVDESEIEDSEY